MSSFAAEPGQVRRPLRWGLPVVLLVPEWVALTLLVDLPGEGPARALASGVRLAGPVIVGAAGAGWLLARRAAPAPAVEAPRWRPGPALAVQLASFVVTAWLALRLFGPDVPPAGPGPLVAWLCCAALAGLAAVATAAPLGWIARRARASLGPPLLALILGMVAWRAAEAAEALWGALSSVTLRGAAALLGAGSGQVRLDAATHGIGLGAFAVGVAPECSGADGVGLVLVFQAMWIALARERLVVGRALLLLPLGAAAAIAANVARVAALVAVGASGHEALALGAFHSRVGWALFVALALGTVAIAERWRWLRRPVVEDVAPAVVPPSAAAYLGPFLATLATAFLTGAVADGVDRWYGLRLVAGLLALAFYRRSLPRLDVLVRGLGAPLLLGAGVGVVWVLAAAGDAAPLREALGRLTPADRILWLSVRAAGMILVIPLVEELAFRGFLLPWLVSPAFEEVPATAWTFRAVAISSAIFGALHQSWWLGAGAGAAFAVARIRRGRLSDAVLAHAVANAVVAAAALWGGHLDLLG